MHNGLLPGPPATDPRTDVEQTGTVPRAGRPGTEPPAPTVVIAVDGPSGSGKSTVSRELARRLGLRYLDTGAMYRAVTRRVLDAGADVSDPGAVASVASRVRLEPGTDPHQPTIRADGVDVTAAVRTPEVTEAVSAVSAVPAVRERMVAQQRRIIGPGGIVVEGRDIGTAVAPNADLKVYLVADAGARANRRTLELRSKADEAATAETQAALLRRDAADSGRAASPLTRAPDAVEIDTTELSVDEVVAALLDLVRDRNPNGRAVPTTAPSAQPVPAKRARSKLVRSRGRTRPWMIEVAWKFGHWLLRRAFRVRMVGAENVPLEGPVIIAGNHTSFLDGPFVFALGPRSSVFFIKSELYDGRLSRVLDWLGQIPINRGRPDRPALRRGLAALADGHAVGMFPEGSRGSGDLESVQHGIAYLALKAGCPVVPVACFGTGEALPMGRKWPKWRGPVEVVFGAPFVVQPEGDPSARRLSAESAEIIRRRLHQHLTASAASMGRPVPRRPPRDPDSP